MIGTLLFTYLVILSIFTGRTSGFGRYSLIVGEYYTAAVNPSQFWLLAHFYAIAATVFAYFVALISWLAHLTNPQGASCQV